MTVIPLPAHAEQPREEPPRAAFLRYVEKVLTPLLHACTLLEKGRPLHVEAFSLRGATAHATIHPLCVNPEGQGVPALLKAHVEALSELTVLETAQEPSAPIQWRSRLDQPPEHGALPPPPVGDGDFVFSYPLPSEAGAAADAPAEAGPEVRHAPALTTTPGLAAYLAELVPILLDTVEFLEQRQPVLPDAVRLGEAQLPIGLLPLQLSPDLGPRTEGSAGSGWRQPLHSVAATEPALVTLARHWALLLRYLNLYEGQQPLHAEGFRLRHLSDWLVPSSGDPSEVYEYLARVCNVSCKFCYLYGNPSTMAIARGKRVASGDELSTRLKYFDPQARRALFRAQWEINEFLVDPKLPAVLRELRRRTDKPFLFITNGSPLIPRVIELLAEVKPVDLIVSINSMDQQLRAEVMQETRTQTMTAMSCLERLAHHEIPFGVSLAAFPEFSLEKLEDTIRRVEPLRPAFIRVNLPGFTREMPYHSTFDTEAYWRRVVEWVRALRHEVSVPLLTIPSAFEEGTFHEEPNAPRLLGVVPESPAARSGLRPGDVVRRVGFLDIQDRSQLQATLFMLNRPTELEVERSGRVLTCKLDPAGPRRYPFERHHVGKYPFPLGVVCAPSLSYSEAVQIREAIEETGARDVWVMTSALMRKAAEALVQRELPELADRITYVHAQNEYLGGNIRIMDMCTVGDLGGALGFHLSRRSRPDLVLLPASGFNSQGRDITGRHWGDLERWLSLPIRLIHMAQFPY